MRFLDSSWSRGPRQEAGNSVVRSAQGRGTSVRRQSKKIRKKRRRSVQSSRGKSGSPWLQGGALNLKTKSRSRLQGGAGPIVTSSVAGSSRRGPSWRGRTLAQEELRWLPVRLPRSPIRTSWVIRNFVKFEENMK